MQAHGIDPSCIRQFLPCSARCGEAAGLRQLPTAIHSVRAAVTDFEEHRGKYRGFAFRGFHGPSIRVPQTRGCHAFASKPRSEPFAEALSGRDHLCGRGPRRRIRAIAGIFPLCGLARRPAHQCHERFRRHGLVPFPRAFAQRRRRAVAKALGTSAQPREKFFAWRGNQPSTPPLMVRRRAKPPSPSPSITRRRTPAVLAAGVHLFGAGRIRSQQAPSGFVSDPR